MHCGGVEGGSHLWRFIAPLLFFRVGDFFVPTDVNDRSLSAMSFGNDPVDNRNGNLGVNLYVF